MIDEPQEQSNTSAGGEDDSGTERNGDDSHLHEDQKSPASKAAQNGAKGAENGESPTKTQDLAKAGRPGFDPNAGEE